MDRFDNISPIDFRYYGGNKDLFNKLNGFLSERAAIKYLLKVESALAETTAQEGICSKDISQEIVKACKAVSAEEVYKEEARIKHNIRAVANSIRKKVSREAQPYVHFMATSNDIISTAEAARMKDAVIKAVIPELVKLEKNLIKIAIKGKNTVQIGRTHGQHAEPITFGFAMSEYVSRLGNKILELEKAAENMRGKFSGAVGAYNSSSLFVKNPQDFEKKLLKKIGLKPSSHSTQVVEPEYMADLVHQIISGFGVLANLADDMRHLQRSEIGEVTEIFGTNQVGSSTMPHKRNPISFENVKSLWKEFMPRMTTVYLDQITEHQRDLTNSASARFIPEIIAGYVIATDRMNRTMERLVVDKKNLKKNFDASKGMIAAEPLYLVLAAKGHPNAHEEVRKLTLKSQKTGKKIQELLVKDAKLMKYVKKFSKNQLEVIMNPEKYTGISSKKTEEVCKYWGEKIRET